MTSKTPSKGFVEAWGVESLTSSTVYTVSKRADGSYACSCPYWKFHKQPKPTCKHIAALLMGNTTVDDTKKWYLPKADAGKVQRQAYIDAAATTDRYVARKPPETPLGDASSLIEWLNGAESSPAIDLLKDLREAAVQARFMHASIKGGRVEVIAARQYNRAAKRVNDHLKSCKAFPQIAMASQLGLTWTWIPAELDREFSFTDGLPKDRKRRQRLQSRLKAIDATLTLLSLSRDGRLDRIRQCKQCQRWFWARFARQEFHERVCQQKFYRSSPEWREHRSNWMREYRRVKALINVK